MMPLLDYVRADFPITDFRSNVAQDRDEPRPIGEILPLVLARYELSGQESKAETAWELVGEPCI